MASDIDTYHDGCLGKNQTRYHSIEAAEKSRCMQIEQVNKPDSVGPTDARAGISNKKNRRMSSSLDSALLRVPAIVLSHHGLMLEDGHRLPSVLSLPLPPCAIVIPSSFYPRCGVWYCLRYASFQNP